MRSLFVVSIVLVLFVGLMGVGTTNVAASTCGAPGGIHNIWPDGCGCAGVPNDDYSIAPDPGACGGGGDPGGHPGGNGYLGQPNNMTDPIMGPPGTIVHISTIWAYPDSSCTIASSTSGLVTGSSCSIANGNVQASFVVGNVPAGIYLIQISGNHYQDVATATFIVQS